MNQPSQPSIFGDADLPPIDPSMIAAAVPAVVAPAAVDLRKVDLMQLALSKFGDWRREVADLKQRFANVAWDLTTKKGVDSLKDAIRQAQQPRYDLQNMTAELKTKMAHVSKAIGGELEAVQAGFGEVENPLLKILADHTESEKKAKKQREEAAAARRIAFDVKLNAIRANAARCEGISAERIERGIAGVSGIAITADEWQEFAVEADMAKADTLGKMRELHAKAVRDEAAAAETARLAEENQRLQAELAVARARLSSATPAPQAALFQPLPSGEVVDTATGELIAAPADVPAPCASNATETATVAPSGDEDPAGYAEAPAGSAFGPSTGSLRILVDAIAAGELKSPGPRVIFAEPEPESEPDDTAMLLAEALALVEHAREAFKGRFPSQPKPPAAWWEALRQKAEALHPKLGSAIAGGGV